MDGAAGSTSTTSPTPATSRWNPTPEQLLALEEMYKRGMRIPTADQIQQIASQLRRFGKIEGKNVFYWFQNHKARERQKRRREGENNSKIQRQDVVIPDKRESGMRRTVHGELHPTKNSVAFSHCTENTEVLVPMHRAANKAENRTHGWSQFQERKSPQQRNTSTLINHNRWQNGFPSSSSYSPQMFNESSFPCNPKFLTFEGQRNFSNALEDEAREIKTLQLFPRCGEENDDYEVMVRCTKKDTKVPITTINTKFSPGQFFEFLPLKN